MISPWVGFSVEIGPEGGVYILDWHDQDVCGNAVRFPNSGRVYRIMPKGTKPVARPDLTNMTDEKLINLQSHANDWYVRHSRTLLQSRAATGQLDKKQAHALLNDMFRKASTAPKRLRALWALYVTDGLNEERLLNLLDHNDEHVRAWAIQFLCDNSPVNAFQAHRGIETQSRTAPTKQSPQGPSAAALQKFAQLAKADSSKVVRLYLASAVQRLPFVQRWAILEGLASHADDINDNNLPRMYWFALEPMVPHHPEKSLELAVGSRIPTLPEFVARRLVTRGDAGNPFIKVSQSAEFDRTIQKVAGGFRVKDVGEGGVAHHDVFRNASAVRTHPLDRNTPCKIYERNLFLPPEKKSTLKMRVSHHPHGDWQLRVLVNGKPVADQIIGTKTVAADEWLNVAVDLTAFAGRTVSLEIENRANDWHNEWAYWQNVSIVSE